MMRDAEQREKEESLRCQMLCREAAWRVAHETERRLVAEKHAAGVEQWTMYAIEQNVNAVRNGAWLREEADRVVMTKMSERISELESRSSQVQQQLLGHNHC